LDFVIFGALKATARTEYRRFVHDDPERPMETKDAVAMLLCAWGQVSFGTLEGAWDIF
jgi:hypothetical protein